MKHSLNVVYSGYFTEILLTSGSGIVYNATMTDPSVGGNEVGTTDNDRLDILGGTSVYRRTRLTYLLLAALLTAALLVSGCGKKEDAAKETEISVATVQAEVRDIAKSVRYAGVVRGQNEVYLLAKVPARVTGIFAQPGDRVGQGQVLVTLDSSDYQAGAAQAEAGRKSAAIQVENARLALERTQKLFAAGAASQQQLEAAQSGYDAAQVGMEQAEAALAMASVQLNNCTITSPISGVVGSVNLSLGDTANPQTPAAVVSETSQLEIEIMVSESEISYIEPGSPVDIHVRAAGDQPFKGQVGSAATVPDPVKRNYAVKISLENPDNQIKSGMFAEVAVNTLSKEKAVCVPSNAVVPKGARSVVYVVDQEKRAQEREVTVGIQNSHLVEIEKGIKAGEQVITRGSTLVTEGTLVRVVAGGGK